MLQYLLAATVLAGLIQIAAGLLRLGYVMRFVSRSVMTGFVNALAILIFMAQLPELIGVPWLTYVMVAAGLGIIYLFPLLTKSGPSPQPDAVIAGTVENEGINLLVIGAYGHSRIRSFVIGSTTTEMIRSCKVPVMLFR